MRGGSEGVLVCRSIARQYLLGAEQLELAASETVLVAGSEVPRLLFILDLDLLLLGNDCCRCLPPGLM